MADLVVTASLVSPGAGATKLANQICGEALTVGQQVYRSPTDNRWYRGIATLIPNCRSRGIALNSTAGAGQAVSIQTGGDINIGATTAAGTIYCVSAAAAGGIAPWADLAATNYVVPLGIGRGSGVLALWPRGVFPPLPDIAHA